MEKNLYIDASHPNETRIVLKTQDSIEEYEFENKNNYSIMIRQMLLKPNVKYDNEDINLRGIFPHKNIMTK